MSALPDSQYICTSEPIAPNPVPDLLSCKHVVESGFHVELLPYQVPHPVILRQMACHNISIAHLMHLVDLFVLLFVVPLSDSFCPLARR